VDPQTVSSVPAFLAVPVNSYGHVPGTVPQGSVPPHEGGDRDGAEPQRDPEEGEDDPDHVIVPFFDIMVASGCHLGRRSIELPVGALAASRRLGAIMKRVKGIITQSG
jgi:hypothetical protein